MEILESTLTELRDTLVGSVRILDELLRRPTGITNGDGSALPLPKWGKSDWPDVDLSHLSVRMSIREWLKLLGRTASPSEIMNGVSFSRPSTDTNRGTLSQSIFELAKEGKIKHPAWGQYAAGD